MLLTPARFIDLSLALDSVGTPVHAKFLMRSPVTVLAEQTSIKSDRGVGREVSQLIFQRTGVLIPVRSGMIRSSALVYNIY